MKNNRQVGSISRVMCVVLAQAALIGLTVGGCKSSASPKTTSGSATVVITQTNMCYPAADGYNYDHIWLKNTGTGTAYYVTVGGAAANPSTIPAGGTSGLARRGCNGPLDVRWSNTP